LFGVCGNAAAGRPAPDELRSEGVDAWLQVDARRPTGRCIVLVEPGGERTMLPDAGANAGLEEALPDGARHLHVAGYALLHPGSRPAALGTVSRARATGVPFSVDPSSAAPLARVGADRFLDWVEGTALLLPNRAEAAVLAGIEDAEAAARALCTRGIGEVVVKLGAGGALWTDGNAVLRASARPVVAEADTTGAGDAFAAGLLAARLAGAAPAEALEAGCELAARAVGRAGAR
jgi:ribokinase